MRPVSKVQRLQSTEWTKYGIIAGRTLTEAFGMGSHQSRCNFLSSMYISTHEWAHTYVPTAVLVCPRTAWIDEDTIQKSHALR